MRKFLLAAILLYTGFIQAQDSTGASKMSMGDTAQRDNYRLYNYSSSSINNVFDENMRPGALNRITVYGDYANNSTSVPALLGLDLIFHYDVTDALKNRVDNRIHNFLKFEDNLKAGVAYERYLKKWNGAIFFSYNQRQMRDISATKQAYELVFYGNARFEGDTVNMSNLVFQNFIYNQYAIGIKKTINTPTYQMQLGVSLSFLQVVNNQDIHTNNAWLYTAPYGEYIDMKYDLTFNNARDGAPSFTQLNGAGVSGDFNLAVMNHDKWKLALNISDIGTMVFNNNPVNYTGANFVHFQGIGLPDLGSFSSQTFDTLNIDSAARSNLPKKTNNKYSLPIPFTIAVVFSKPLLHDRLVLNFGLQYHNIEGYHVYGYFKTNYFIRRDMVISATAAAGGYSLFNLGFEFAKTWKYFDLALGSGNLIGLVLPAYYTGAGLYVRMGTTF